jgi:hypothetical protein
MRTTLDIADDVLFAAKDFARRDKKTLGQVISEWSRSALQASTQPTKKSSKKTAAMTQSEREKRFYELGFRTFPSRAGGPMVTNEMVNRIREEEGI